MRARSLCFATIGSFTVSLACGETAVTPLGAPELVLSEIRLGGADRVAARIDSDVRFGQTVMDGIATGDSLWLEVAKNLPLRSAAAEASLAIALSGALPRNPDGVLSVLSLIGQRARVVDVCGMPLLDGDAAAVIAYYDAASAALARPRPPSFAGIALQCASALDSARARKLARIDPSYLVKNKPVAPRPAPRRRRGTNRRR